MEDTLHTIKLLHTFRTYMTNLMKAGIMRDQPGYMEYGYFMDMIRSMDKLDPALNDPFLDTVKQNSWDISLDTFLKALAKNYSSGDNETRNYIDSLCEAIR